MRLKEFYQGMYGKLNEVDDDQMIKYKDGDGGSSEMPASSAKKMAKDHPAKVEYDKLAGSDDGAAKKGVNIFDEPSDDEPKVPAPDSRSDTGKPRVSANPHDDNFGQEVDDDIVIGKNDSNRAVTVRQALDDTSDNSTMKFLKKKAQSLIDTGDFEGLGVDPSSAGGSDYDKALKAADDNPSKKALKMLDDMDIDYEETEDEDGNEKYELEDGRSLTFTDAGVVVNDDDNEEIDQWPYPPENWGYETVKDEDGRDLPVVPHNQWKEESQAYLGKEFPEESFVGKRGVTAEGSFRKIQEQWIKNNILQEEDND